MQNKDFTIISNNCWGGFLYQRLGLQYKTPFIGLYLFAPDYIEFLQDFKKNINSELKFIEANESKYKKILIENETFGKYPIGIINNKIEIHFLHYESNEEASEKWKKRIKRINIKNMLVKFSDRDLCNPDLINRFDKLPFKNKICFTSKEYSDLDSVVVLDEFKDKECVENEWDYCYKYIDIIKMLNDLEKS